MKSFPRPSRLLLAALVAAAAGALVAGLMVARGGAGTTAPAGVLARGSFVADGWATAGDATIVRAPSGALKLRLSKSFRTKEAPELYVYLVHYVGGVRKDRTQIAALRSADGAQEYALHGVTARTLRSSVDVFCGKCNASFGHAQLKPTGLRLS